jgi:hypothetical protein
MSRTALKVRDSEGRWKSWITFGVQLNEKRFRHHLARTHLGEEANLWFMKDATLPIPE